MWVERAYREGIPTGELAVYGNIEEVSEAHGQTRSLGIATRLEVMGDDTILYVNAHEAEYAANRHFPLPKILIDYLSKEKPFKTGTTGADEKSPALRESYKIEWGNLALGGGVILKVPVFVLYWLVYAFPELGWTGLDSLPDHRPYRGYDHDV